MTTSTQSPTYSKAASLLWLQGAKDLPACARVKGLNSAARAGLGTFQEKQQDFDEPRFFQKVGGGAFIYRLGADRWCLGPTLYGEEIIWAESTCSDPLLPSSTEHSWASAYGKPEVYITRSSIFVVQGVGLRAADLDDNSNPYIVCKISGKPQLGFKTQTRFKSLDPVWHEWVDLDGLELGDTMHFKVFSHEDNKEDEFLGEGKIAVTPAGYDGGVTLLLRGRKAGTIRLELTVPPPVAQETEKKQQTTFDSNNPRELVHRMTWGTAQESVAAVASLDTLLTSDGIRSRFVAAGVVQPLVALLSDKSVGVRCKAAKALANLAQCTVGRRILATTGGLQALMMLFDRPEPDCKEAALAVLVHVAGGDKAQEQLVAGGILPQLTFMLENADSPGLPHAVRLLGHLAAIEEVGNGLLEGFLGQLLALLGEDQPDEVNLSAAFTLGRLLNTDDRRKTLIEAHVVHKLMRLLAQGNYDCQAEAASTIAALTETQHRRFFKKVFLHMMESGVLPPLLALVCSSHEVCASQAARAIVALAGTARSCEAILAQGVLRDLVAFLRPPTSPGQTIQVAKVLKALASFKQTEMKLELSQESGQELLMQALQRVPDKPGPEASKVTRTPRPLVAAGGDLLPPILSKTNPGRKMLPMDAIARSPRKLPPGMPALPPLHCLY
mmetsp:Transcript_4370/g.10127  ORF Transcript_4370/g.10127 Transcript_4370/m.10127 type:complete len:668 (+) Transcript_4370:38-2041(+)